MVVRLSLSDYSAILELLVHIPGHVRVVGESHQRRELHAVHFRVFIGGLKLVSFWVEVGSLENRVFQVVQDHARENLVLSHYLDVQVSHRSVDRYGHHGDEGAPLVPEQVPETK